MLSKFSDSSFNDHIFSPDETLGIHQLPSVQDLWRLDTLCEFSRLLLTMAIYNDFCPLNMVIFHSYVSLPEGRLCLVRQHRFSWFTKDVRYKKHHCDMYNVHPSPFWAMYHVANNYWVVILQRPESKRDFPVITRVSQERMGKNDSWTAWECISSPFGIGGRLRAAHNVS